MFNINAILNIVGANTSSVQRSVEQVNTQLNRGTRTAHAFSDALALRGVNLGAYAIATTAVFKLQQAISGAVGDAIRFELELAKIAQTTEKDTKEIGKHADAIRKMSVAYGLSAPKIAETIRVLSQAGYSFEQAKAAADSLSQTTLLSSFDSITDSTDGLIAVNKQFAGTMGQSAKVLAIFNTVAKKYAVESSDLVEATRKAGGVFSSTGGKLEELAAIFTVVRDTTRESAETVATALRTVFTRLQRPQTIEDLRQYGIELTDLKGNFVGNYEAIQRIQKGLEQGGIKKGSIKFAEVVEKIGGVRQQSTVIPLLTQGAKLTQIYGDATNSLADSTKDAAKVQETLSFQLSQTQQNFAKLISEISETNTFKSVVTAVLSLANAFASFASSLKEVIPLLGIFGAFQLGRSITSVLARPALLRAAATGQVGSIRLAGGGPVGGPVFASQGTDTVPAMLTPGEFVIPVAKARAFGYRKLEKIRRDGYLATGGTVGSISTNLQSDIDRGYLSSGEIIKNIERAKNLFVDFISGLPDLVSSHLSGVKLGVNPPRDARGSYTNSIPGQINLAIPTGDATAGTLRHEGGHAVDHALGRSLGQGEHRFASKTSGTFQSELTEAAKKNLTSIVQASNYTDEYKEYLLRNQELFAELFHTSDPAIREIIASTTDAKVGMESLAQYIAKQNQAEFRLYGDVQTALQARVDAIRAATKAQTGSAPPVVPPGGLGYPGSIPPVPPNNRVPPNFFGPAPTVTRGPNGRFSPLPIQGPPSPPPIPPFIPPNPYGSPPSRGNRLPYNFFGPAGGGGSFGPPIPPIGGLGYPGSHGGNGLPSHNPSGAFGPFRRERDPSQELTANFGTMAAIVAGTANQFTEQGSALRSFSPALASVISSFLGIITTLGFVQAALASFGARLTAEEYLKGFKRIIGGGGLLGNPANIIGTRLNPLGSSGGGLLGRLGGQFPTVRAIAGSVSRESLANVGRVAGGFAAAGAAAYGFGRVIDSARDLEGKRNKAVADGNVAEAGRAAATLQAQEDINKLSVGAALVGTALGGPIVGAIAGVSVKLLGLIPGAETLIGKLRDAGAALGLFESSALIEARARDEAASIQLDKRANNRSSQISERQKALGKTINSSEFLNSPLLKEGLSDFAIKKAESDKRLAELNKQAESKVAKVNLGTAITNFSSGDQFGPLVKIFEEVDSVKESLKNSASTTFSERKAGYELRINEFIQDGKTSFSSYINSLEENEVNMIRLSGNTKVLRETFDNLVAVTQLEADQRATNYELELKTTTALKGLEEASKKAQVLSSLSDIVSGLGSGNFRSSSLSNAAENGTIADKTRIAGQFGIKNFASILGESSKTKDALEKAREARSKGGGDDKFRSFLEKTVSELNPNVGQDELSKTSLQDLESQVQKVADSADVVTDALSKTAKQFENGFNSYLDSLSNASEAQLAYNSSLLEFGDAQRSRRKDLETFSSSGTTVSDIRDRRSSISQLGSAAGLRQRAFGLSSALTATGVGVAALTSRGLSGSENGVKLQGDFAALQIATRNQVSLIKQDIQVRQQLIDSLKEELALEAGRAKSFADVNRALSGQLGTDAKRGAQRTVSAANSVEQAFATGGLAGANQAIGNAVNRGENADTLIQFLPAAIAQALNQEAQLAGAAQSGQGAFGREARNVAATGFTAQGAVLANGVIGQSGEQAANEATLLKLQNDNVLLLSESAKIFGDSIGIMAGQFTNFSNELRNIVTSLQGTSIALTLPTTQVVVTLNGAEALAGFQREMKAFVMQAVSDSIIAQQQGQI